MAIPEYKPFDYFYTPTHEFRWRKDLLEKYGLTEGEIIQYRKHSGEKIHCIISARIYKKGNPIEIPFIIVKKNWCFFTF